MFFFSRTKPEKNVLAHTHTRKPFLLCVLSDNEIICLPIMIIKERYVTHAFFLAFLSSLSLFLSLFKFHLAAAEATETIAAMKRIQYVSGLVAVVVVVAVAT